MSANPWPWSDEEEAQWELELSQQEFGWIDELIDHMISDSLAGSSYDPLERQEEQFEGEAVASQNTRR